MNEINHHRCEIHLDQQTGECIPCRRRRQAEYRGRKRLKLQALQKFYDANNKEVSDV